jgi:hypothetical protein
MNHPDFEEITRKRNRENKVYPISSKRLWCDKCDARTVNIGETCTNCNWTWKTKHRKKR